MADAAARAAAALERHLGRQGSAEMEKQSMKEDDTEEKSLECKLDVPLRSGPCPPDLNPPWKAT